MLRPLLKSVLPACLIFGTIGTLSPASAQFTRSARADASVDAAQDMLAWMQQSGSVVQELVPLMGDDLLGDLLAPLAGDDVDLEALAASVQSYEIARAEILARSQSIIDNLPPPEKWNFDRSLFSSQERGIYKASQQQYADLQGTHDAFASISGDILESSRKISQGEFVDMQPVLESMSGTSLRILKSENRILEAVAASMPSTTPNKDFHEIMIALNNSTIVEMEMLADYQTDIDPLSKRQSYGRRMKAALSDIPILLENGRAKISSEINQYEDQLSTRRFTDKERRFMQALIPAVATFEQSFDIEEKLMQSDLANANLYLSDKSDQDIELELEINSANLVELINQRMSVSMERMQALQ